jgi:hypothetical protein
LKVGFSAVGTRRIAVSSLLLLASLCSNCDAQQVPDALLMQRLVGSWTPVLDPSEEIAWSGSRAGVFAVEEFAADGTGQTTFFRGRICSANFRISHFRWRIHQGILITDESDGAVLRDRILTLTPARFAIRSLEDSAVVRRDRHEACTTAGT